MFIPFFLCRYAKGLLSGAGVALNRLQFALPKVRRKPRKENRRGIPANRRTSGGQNPIVNARPSYVSPGSPKKNSQLILASVVAGGGRKHF